MRRDFEHYFVVYKNNNEENYDKNINNTDNNYYCVFDTFVVGTSYYTNNLSIL